jgi:hypothetical protein
MEEAMNIVDITNAVPNKRYRVYITDDVAKTIKIAVYSGYGREEDGILDDGWYMAMFKQCKYAVGQPKWWEIYHGDEKVESDNPDIKGYSVSETDDEALQIIFGVK